MTQLQDKTWFGQPRGLTILFLTEMWEFFSYYGMRTLLVYYMTKHLLFAQEKSSFIYGAYTATAYFTPIVGGVLADRWLGKRKAVILGGSAMALGHFMMTFEPLFYLALATIALGNGLFVPSLPSQINDLYAADDPRRGRAYNISYAGIHMGGVPAPLICVPLGDRYGWHDGLGAPRRGRCGGAGDDLTDFGESTIDGGMVRVSWLVRVNMALVLVMVVDVLRRMCGIEVERLVGVSGDEDFHVGRGNSVAFARMGFRL